MMKIAHINNIAGIGSIIAGEQCNLGYQADVFVFNDTIFRQFGGIKVNYKFPISRWKLFRKLNEYDVWHYHYPYGSLKKNLERRNYGKIYLKHYHGDDLRGRHDDDYCLVSTPDLLSYAPNAIWLPIPLNTKNTNLTVQNRQPNSKLRIAHYAYYKMYQSNDYYSEVLNYVEKAGKCEIVKVLHLTHRETLEVISTCDIVLGKIIPKIGWFGKFELEGMALGKPVIAYVSEELYSKYRPPIYRTTKDSFKNDLEDLIQDTNIQEKLSKQGPEYVKEHHSPEKIIRVLERAYLEKRF